MQPNGKPPRNFRKEREKLRVHARDLIRLRPRMPAHARRFASTMAEQIFQIETEADLDRLRPFMAYERKRLQEALRKTTPDHRGDNDEHR